MKWFAGTVMVAALLGGASDAQAAPVLDQSQLTFNVGFLVSDVVGQSFTAGLSGELNQIDLYRNGPANGGTVNFDVFAGGGFGGAVLGSLTGFAIPSDVGGTPIAFGLGALDINVTAGSVYTFRISAVTSNQQILGASGNPYAGGQLYWFGPQANSDLMFATHVDTGIVPGVPEPTTLGLMAAACLATLKRSRARRS